MAWQLPPLPRTGAMALFETLGFGYEKMTHSNYAWPLVGINVKYVRPLRSGETIEVTATFVEYEHRIKIDYVTTDAVTGGR